MVVVLQPWGIWKCEVEFSSCHMVDDPGIWYPGILNIQSCPRSPTEKYIYIFIHFPTFLMIFSHLLSSIQTSIYPSHILTFHSSSASYFNQNTNLAASFPIYSTFLPFILNCPNSYLIQISQLKAYLRISLQQSPLLLSWITFLDSCLLTAWFSPFRGYIILWVYTFVFHFLSSHSLKFTPISLSSQSTTETTLVKVL